MTIKGPWSQQQIAEFFEEVRVPLRVACNGLSGTPVLASLWYLPEEGRLWCATQSQSSAARLLAENGRCAFEVSLENIPYRGVRGQGSAELAPSRGEEILRRLIDRYLSGTASKLAQTLLERVDTETAIVITPERLVAWDFSERMTESRN